ncbi:MAG: chemotaxis protein CheD [Prolixibacteraceae bacterium]|nr:chemotaxis protein CheD [Prolixibacteraceae bacterium]
MAIVSGDTKVFTILGSCVAVVLWDEQTKIGGVNHYLLPNWNNKGAPDVRYGDVAVTELHDKTILSGAVKRRMVAKIYGGASLLNLESATFNIGQRNINIAKEKLKELNIQIIEEQIGGTTGRKILFDPQTGYVKVDLIRNINF